MVTFFKRASEKKGLPAGSLVYVGDTIPLPTEITFVEFTKDKQAIKTSVPVENNLHEKVSELSKKGGWLHVAGLENIHAIRTVCETLGVHELIIEDILNTDQSTKIELLSDYTLVVAKAPGITSKLDPIQLQQISFILKGKLLLTFQESHVPLIYQVETYLKHFTTKLFFLDSGHLLYLILDMIIDEHLLVVDQKGDELESLEENIIEHHENIRSDTLYLLKRDMLHLRKNTMGLRNITNMLIHEHEAILPQLPLIYVRDLQDHLNLIIESIDIHRELSKNILDIYISIVNTKINETMKVLAVFAAIFIPLTFITGFYGMNFESIPITHVKNGHLYVLGLMIIVSGGLLYFFRKKKWI